mmetsp:Transcript_44316/g.73908  ORF Transcript_44316/g.73908 Transcript_44316/m.73908 type:complete len:196 (+) Transcript_44316:1126-1713(+)
MAKKAIENPLEDIEYTTLYEAVDGCFSCNTVCGQMLESTYFFFTALWLYYSWVPIACCKAKESASSNQDLINSVAVKSNNQQDDKDTNNANQFANLDYKDDKTGRLTVERGSTIKDADPKGNIRSSISNYNVSGNTLRMSSIQRISSLDPPDMDMKLPSNCKIPAAHQGYTNFLKDAIQGETRPELGPGIGRMYS